VSKASEVSITYSATGDGMTLTFTSTTQENAASPGEQQPLLLATGDNTITVPTGAKGVIVVPPAASTVVKKLDRILRLHDRANYGVVSRAPRRDRHGRHQRASAGETISLVWM
jgi:hypothetical protein